MRLSGGGLGAHAVLEPPLYLKTPIIPVLEPIGGRISLEAPAHHQRNVESGAEELVDAAKAFRRHTDDSKLDSIHIDGTSDDVGRGSILASPGIVADHGHGVTAGNRVFVRPESAAQLRCDFES